MDDERITSTQQAIDFYTDTAIAAYRAVLNAELKLDEAKTHLERSVTMNIDMERYHEVTAKMDKEMERKRSRRGQTRRQEEQGKGQEK
jgi:hypothetical protein